MNRRDFFSRGLPTADYNSDYNCDIQYQVALWSEQPRSCQVCPLCRGTGEKAAQGYEIPAVSTGGNFSTPPACIACYGRGIVWDAA